MTTTRGVTGAVALAVLFACAEPPSPEPGPFRAQREDLRVEVFASGELRAVRSKELVAPAMSQRMRLARLVDDGKTVEAGEPLAQLDPQEVMTTLRDREADLGTAKKELEKLALEAQGEIDRLEVDRERTQVELDKAGVRAGIDPDLSSRVDIEKARADVTALTKGLAEKGRGVTLARQRTARKRASLEAALGAAEEAVQVARDQLAAMSLVAPVAGTALVAESWSPGGKRKLQVGDTVWRGQALVTIPDLREMEAVLFVDEADIARVAVGQNVTIRLDAAPERLFRGKLAFVPPLAETLSWSNPAKVFRVVATLAETDPDLMRPGLRLKAEIEVAVHEQVVTVPLLAVVENEGRTWVELKNGERREVTLGERNDARVIATGVDDGTELKARSGASGGAS